MRNVTYTYLFYVQVLNLSRPKKSTMIDLNRTEEHVIYEEDQKSAFWSAEAARL